MILGVGTGVLIIGVGTAWLVTMCRFPGRRTMEWALLVPMAVPAYVIAYTYTGLFEFAGPVQTALREASGWTRQDYWFPEIRSLGGAITMMTLVFYPYVYLLTRAAFLEQSVCVLEVSRTLGCGPWRSFFTVALPLARPGIVAGLTLALMETLNDFGTVQYFAVDTFTTGIYRTWLGMGEAAAAAQLAAVLIDITPAQAGQTADVGVDGGGSGSADTLLDGVSLAATGAFSGFANAGTNGAAFRKLDAKGGTSDYVTVTASGTPSTLAGNAYVIYVPVS